MPNTEFFDATTRVNGGVGFCPPGPDNDALVLIYPPGPNLGRKYNLDSHTVNLGRDISNHIVIPSCSVSRHHAQLTGEAGLRLVTDLRSTNGTYVNDVPVASGYLKNGDLLRVGDNIFKYLVGSDVESAYHEEIYLMTIKDGLTNIYNKRYFGEALERELWRAHRHHRQLALIIFDIDFFKKVNDTHGHLAGDHVLRELAALIAGRLRQEEVFARYGGEEFVVLLPESDGQEAAFVAEQLRKLVEAHRFEFDGKEIFLTISVGFTVIDGHRRVSAAEVIKAADAQLYRAKSGGRNCLKGAAAR